MAGLRRFKWDDGAHVGCIGLMMFYSKTKGRSSFSKELLALFGPTALWIFNLGLNIIEFVAKTFS